MACVNRGRVGRCCCFTVGGNNPRRSEVCRNHTPASRARSIGVHALKPSLVQSDRGLEYGSTRVVDMADLSDTAKLPTAPQPVEIVERTERPTIQKLRSMSASEYAPRMNPNFRREVEALLE